MDEIWDVAVIGSGIVGTCAAYHAAKKGLKTINIEQFTFGHSKGSSHGKSRILEHVHEHADFIPIVVDSKKQIEEMGKRKGEKLFTKTGLLWLTVNGDHEQLTDTMDLSGSKYEVLTGSEVSARFPIFSYDDTWMGVLDVEAGVLNADRCLKAFHEEFLALGGRFMDNCEVSTFDDGNVVTVHTSNGVVSARHLIVAPGTWINKLLPSLPAKTKNESPGVCFFKIRDESDKQLIKPENMPCFNIFDKEDMGYWGIPESDYPGCIKLCSNGGDEFIAGEKPPPVSEIHVTRPSDHVRDHFPKLNATPHIVDRCRYTKSPDMKYYIDYFENSKNIVVCGMMSGCGFQTSPGLGRALVCMVTGSPLPFDLSIFSSKRFLHKNT